jgi:ribosome-binding factor A
VADAPRARKLAKRIAQIVASALEHEVKDPRLARVTITDARVTADLHDATVYYTVLGDKLDVAPDTRGAAAALESAKGVLRSRVGAGTGVRFTPTLTFVADTVPEDAKHIDELLAKAQAADEEVARLANGAKPAGDPDPYRAPRQDSDEDSTADPTAD